MQWRLNWELKIKLISLPHSNSTSVTFTALLANRRVSRLSEHIWFQLSTCLESWWHPHYYQFPSQSKFCVGERDQGLFTSNDIVGLTETKYMHALWPYIADNRIGIQIHTNHKIFTLLFCNNVNKKCSSAVFHCKCDSRSVCLFFLISLQRHRTSNYRARQRLDSLIQQRALWPKTNRTRATRTK